MRLPSYLKRNRHGVYYFRVVASRLITQQPTERCEFAVSLRTSDRRTAVDFSKVLSARLITVLPHLRVAMHSGNGEATTMVNDIKRWFGNMVQLMRASAGGHGGTESSIKSLDALKSNEALRDVVRGILLEQGALYQAPIESSTLEYANTAAPNFGSTPPLDTTSQLSNALNAIAGALQGMASTSSSPVVRPAIPCAVSISDWAAKNSIGWTEKTRQEFVRIGNQFAAFLAGLNIHSLENVESPHVEEYVRHLLENHKLPFKRKGKDAGLSPKTVTKHVDTLAGLFKWAQLAGRFPKGDLPTAGHRFGKKVVKKTSKPWLPLTLPDLLKLFDPATFLRWAQKPHQFFVMLIMLFHGLRVTEASQLATKDFQQMGVLWTLNICEEVENSRIKTEATIRKVPLHPALIRLGLLRYVDDVRRVAGEGLLFPYLNPNSINGYGDTPGEAINKYMQRVLGDPRKRGHSFRHTTNNWMRQALVSEEDRCQYIGHEHATTNSELYAEQLMLEKLAAIVFPALNFAIDEQKLQYESGRYDSVLQAEIKRRCWLQERKAKQAARASAVSK